MDFKPSKKIEEEVRGQLEPLFSDFYPSSAAYKLFSQSLRKCNEKLKRCNEFLRIINDSIETISNPKALGVMYSLAYLSQVELMAGVHIDLTLLLLISKGYDFHLEPDYKHRYTRHATSLEDLESPALSLSLKLDFLELNGLPFFSKWIDRDFRNKIAHMDFEIDHNGRFFLITKKGKKAVDIVQKWQTLAEYTEIVRNVFTEQIRKTRKPSG